MTKIVRLKTKQEYINELGTEMAQLFSEQYDYMSPKEQVQVFFAAIRGRLHMHINSNDDLQFMSSIQKEVEQTLDLAKCFMA